MSLFPVVAVLIQGLGAAPDPAPAQLPARPVRVWLGGGAAVAPGDPAQVFVETAAPGYLLVLHQATNGSIAVLFPGAPSGDPFVTAGTYELRQPGDLPGFVAAGPAGVGFVLAALSPTPFRFTEFVRAGTWSPGALIASWTGADAEGALTDIVQRMLGDGYFNYDIVAYSVVPRPVALESAPAAPSLLGTCIGCSFVNVPLIEPVVPLLPVWCDAFFATCFGFVPFVPRHATVESGICGIRSPCPEGNRTSALALNVAPTSRARVAPRGTEPLRPALPRRPTAQRPVAPRSRLPDAAAAPARRGAHALALPTMRRRAGVATQHALRATEAATGAVATRARLTLPRIPRLAPSSDVLRAEPALPVPGLVPTPANKPLAAAASPANAALRRSATSAPAPPLPIIPSVPVRPAVAAHAGQRAVLAAGGGAGPAARTIALPHAARSGMSGGVARSRARPR